MVRFFQKCGLDNSKIKPSSIIFSERLKKDNSKNYQSKLMFHILQ